MGIDVPSFFCNDDDLAMKLIDLSQKTGDPLWQLPLWENYSGQLNSAHADFKNIGNSMFGGAITAALFLQKFVKESFAGKLLKIGNEQFINGILSNPATHARNTVGTMINVIKGPTDLLAGSISREGLDPILFRRAMAEFAMFKQAQSDALRLAGQAFKDERNILDKVKLIK